jgi:hypothetical protein
MYRASTNPYTGILIERTFQTILQLPLWFVLIGTTVLLSHGVLDKLARFTYHPADPHVASLVWASYHASLTVLTVILIRQYWATYRLGILLAILPEIDWLILHSIHLLDWHVPDWDEPRIHSVLNILVDSLPFVHWIEEAPDLRYNSWGTLVEIGLLNLLLGCLWHRNHTPSMLDKGSCQ